MKLRTAKKIFQNPERYHKHQIEKAETVAGRAARRYIKKHGVA